MFAKWPIAARVTAIIAVLVIVTLRLYSTVALAVVIHDGFTAAIIFLGAAGLGMWVIRPFVPRGEHPVAQLILGAVAGLGTLSLLVLGLGLAGLLRLGPCVGILGGCIPAGLLRGIEFFRSSSLAAAKPGVPSADAEPSPGLGWLWLLITPFLVIMLLSACFPPGAPLPAESQSYDVLEYHLAVPKEYLANHRITYLPHNIYSNFPFNAEMLYLLAMILRGGALEAVYVAQFLHVGMAILAVAAVWIAARPIGKPAASAAAFVVATCPVVAHLASIAYVENGLLAMAAGALACVLRARNASRDALQDVRWAALAGVLCGLACGFKYTAVPMVLLPLAVAVVWPRRDLGRGAWARLAVFLLGATLTFGPWLAKNYGMTGNPVFPLMRSWFPEKAGLWNDVLAGRWAEGHRPAPDQRSFDGALLELLRGVLASPQFGVLVWVLPLWLIVAAWRRRKTGSTASEHRSMILVCLTLTFVTLLVWLTATHFVSRFAMPLVASQAVLAGLAWQQSSHRRAMATVLACGAVANLGGLIYLRHDAAVFQKVWRDFVGQTEVMTQLDPIGPLNEHLSAGHRILMVAEARTLYLAGAPPQYEYSVIFNPSPLAEAVAHCSVPQLIEWLQTRRIDYVYVDWLEMHRLRGSRYGFWPGVDEGLFGRLVEAGLVIEQEFRFGSNRPGPDATLFAVPNMRAKTDNK